MNQIRALPQSLPSSPTSPQPPEDIGFEGIATNVKLLLKIIQDYNGGKGNDDRKTNRMAGMISIIDEIRSRIQKVQTCAKRRAELRRCNTDLKPNIPKDKRPADNLITDEKERLRRELNASLVARKSLQVMCSSLGKEKEIMARELARKAQQLAEMEEFTSDLKEQNETLLEKIQVCNIEHKGKEDEKQNSNEGEMQGNTALQERHKELSEQLRKSLDDYRILKRKLIETQEVNQENDGVMQEMELEIQAGKDRFHALKGQMLRTDEETDNKITEEISHLENMLRSLQVKISELRKKLNMMKQMLDMC